VPLDTATGKELHSRNNQAEFPRARFSPDGKDCGHTQPRWLLHALGSGHGKEVGFFKWLETTWSACGAFTGDGKIVAPMFARMIKLGDVATSKRPGVHGAGQRGPGNCPLAWCQVTRAGYLRWQAPTWIASQGKSFFSWDCY